jgi:hypothetical protein
VSRKGPKSKENTKEKGVAQAQEPSSLNLSEIPPDVASHLDFSSMSTGTYGYGNRRTVRDIVALNALIQIVVLQAYDDPLISETRMLVSASMINRFAIDRMHIDHIREQIRSRMPKYVIASSGPRLKNEKQLTKALA